MTKVTGHHGKASKATLSRFTLQNNGESAFKPKIQETKNFHADTRWLLL
ncbi:MULTISPECIES: hypothetical protein [unclassified Endozoicomonas]